MNIHFVLCQEQGRITAAQLTTLLRIDLGCGFNLVIRRSSPKADYSGIRRTFKAFDPHHNSTKNNEWKRVAKLSVVMLMAFLLIPILTGTNKVISIIIITVGRVKFKSFCFDYLSPVICTNREMKSFFSGGSDGRKAPKPTLEGGYR